MEALEQANLVPGARYYHMPLSVDHRFDWHEQAMKKLKDSDIVFVDPDNGMLVTSVSKRSARSVKYTLYEEVNDYVQHGQSVLIYNHRSRKPEGKNFHEICSKLQDSTGIQESDILKITFPKYSVRDFLAVPISADHRRRIEAAFASMEKGVWGRMGMCRIPRI